MKKNNGSLLLPAALAAALVLGACSKAPEPAVTVAPPVVGNVSDIDVTEHVKTALQRNDLLKGFNIEVVTLQGDVRLIGVVDSQAQIDEANRVARASDGAHTIHDELKLKQ